MKTPKPHPRMIPREEVLVPHESLPDLQRHIHEMDEEAHKSLASFREELREHGASYFRDWSKKVACQQPGVTIGLGKKKLTALKTAIESAANALPAAVERELPESIIALDRGASSGQIKQILTERLREAVRRTFTPIATLLEGAGYRRDGTWIDAAKGGTAVPLPQDLRERLDGIVDAITGQEVLRSKILVFGEKKQQELAADLWESV